MSKLYKVIKLLSDNSLIVDYGKIVKSFNLSNYLTREIEEVQKLNMNKEEISNTFYRDTSPIKLGDLVKILK